MRSLSKIYGMAGLRLGAMLAQPALLKRLDAMGSMPLSTPALMAAKACLSDDTLIPQRRADNRKIRQVTIDWLQQRGFSTLPSQTNFVMIELDRDAAAVADALREQGVHVSRPSSTWPGRLRASIGTSQQMSRFHAAFAAITS